MYNWIMEYRKKFIALDLETTHLDMREGKIMEVGAAEAELVWDETSKRIKVISGKTFSSLVNPEIEPSTIALSLTGIKKEDLEIAPSWKQVRPELESFLGSVMIIGHNVEFDLG